MDTLRAFGELANTENVKEADLRVLGEMVGRLLARNTSDEELRKHGAVLTRAVTDPFGRGYRASLHDVLTAVLMEREELAASARRYELAHDRDWRKILTRLLDGPKVQRDLGDSASSVSKTLSRMRQEGLVERWPPAWNDARERPHRLTPLGREIANELQPEQTTPAPARELRLYANEGVARPLNSDQVEVVMNENMDPTRAIPGRLAPTP